jgi:hypothetical protein
MLLRTLIPRVFVLLSFSSLGVTPSQTLKRGQILMTLELTAFTLNSGKKEHYVIKAKKEGFSLRPLCVQCSVRCMSLGMCL